MFLHLLLVCGIISFTSVAGDCYYGMQRCSSNYLQKITAYTTTGEFCQYTHTYLICAFHQGCQFTQSDERFILDSVDSKLRATGFSCPFTTEDLLAELKESADPTKWTTSAYPTATWKFYANSISTSKAAIQPMPASFTSTSSSDGKSETVMIFLGISLHVFKNCFL